MTLLPHLASRVFNAPLLIHRPKLDAILAVLGPRIGWAGTSETGLPMMAVGLSRSAPPAPVPGIAVIPIHGTLVRRTLGLEAESGLTSYEGIAASLDAAHASPDVTGVFLDIDSPGGEAAGVFDLADRIAAARAVKPVWAVANEMAFSAAYALASGASKLWVTRMGGVGSIGVLAMHVDQSARDAREGFRYTAVFAGERKNDLNPHEPLSCRSRERLPCHARRRDPARDASPPSPRTARRSARPRSGGRRGLGDAVQAGLADAVGTFEGALGAFAKSLAPRPAVTARALPVPTSSLEAIPMTKRTEALMESPDPVPVPEPVPDPPATPSVTVPPATAREGATDPAQVPAMSPADAVAIAELCTLAGCTHRIAEFLAKGTAPEAVRRELLVAKASAPEVQSRILPDAGTGRPTSLDDNPVVRAAKARAATQRKEI